MRQNDTKRGLRTVKSDGRRRIFQTQVNVFGSRGIRNYCDKGKNNRTRIVEAGAITAYHQQTEFPVIPILLTGDAPKVSSYLLMNKLYAGSMTDETTRSCVLRCRCTAKKTRRVSGSILGLSRKTYPVQGNPDFRGGLRAIH